MIEGRKVFFLHLVLSLFFLLLLGRLFQLQGVEGQENRFLADTNRIAKSIIEAPRGLIFDRHGQVLAGNEPVYVRDNKEISRDEALQAQSENKDGTLSIIFRRKYYADKLFAHVLGYIGEVSEEEMKNGKYGLKGYAPGSLIGRSGLEIEYEDLLRGAKGSETVEVDTKGQVVRRMGQIAPVPGKSLTLAIDEKLQEIAQREMKDEKGAVVATNPQNGEVLIFYSSPSYDPNIFLDNNRQKELAKLITDEENFPLLNRVIAGLYQPGSTFKIVTSIAGLEEGKITENTLIDDPGVIEVNGFKYANWYFTQYGRTEGKVNLVKALSRSTDTYFYKLGEMMGAENLIKWAKAFGLDQKFGIDLPGELPGFIGTPEWKKQSRNENWFLGNTYHMAIGQGDLALTPLGVNLMTAVVANNGKICTPRILRMDSENTPYRPECRDIGIKKDYLDLIKKGMIAACSSGGTAYPFFDFTPQVACKTGTAEVGNDGKTTHAWFTVMAPAANPQIVLTVIVEHGGEGSTVAAPIAKEILKDYLKD